MSGFLSCTKLYKVLRFCRSECKHTRHWLNFYLLLEASVWNILMYFSTYGSIYLSVLTEISKDGSSHAKLLS